LNHDPKINASFLPPQAGLRQAHRRALVLRALLPAADEAHNSAPDSQLASIAR
jgi:hypothetical protein